MSIGDRRRQEGYDQSKYAPLPELDRVTSHVLGRPPRARVPVLPEELELLRSEIGEENIKRISPSETSFLVQLRKSLGIVATACVNAKLSRAWYCKQRGLNPVFRQACESISEAQMDFVESQLMKNVQAGDSSCIRFYLARKARNRGYANEVHVEHSGNQQHTLTVNEAVSQDAIVKILQLVANRDTPAARCSPEEAQDAEDTED